MEHSPGPNRFGSSRCGVGTRCSTPVSVRISKPACCVGCGWSGGGGDRELLLLGSTEAHWECRLWCFESRDRQDDRRYVGRVAAVRSHGGLVVSGARQDGEGHGSSRMA